MRNSPSRVFPAILSFALSLPLAFAPNPQADSGQALFRVSNGNSRMIAINACDVYTLDCTEVATAIPEITANTFSKDGQLWATKHALDPAAAAVIAVP